MEPHTFLGALGLTLIGLAAFFVVMFVVGRRVIPWMLHYIAHAGSRELFRLAVLVLSVDRSRGGADPAQACLDRSEADDGAT